jgi:hypothetical protein
MSHNPIDVSFEAEEFALMLAVFETVVHSLHELGFGRCSIRKNRIESY